MSWETEDTHMMCIESKGDHIIAYHQKLFQLLKISEDENQCKYYSQSK